MQSSRWQLNQSATRQITSNGDYETNLVQL